MTKKIYFLSDIHLGSLTYADPLAHERRVVRFLDTIKHDAEAIYLLGDILDFWFEYKRVVPRGYTRFFGKIAELTDAGIAVHWFIGNHDIWIFDYLPRELGVIVHRSPLLCTLHGKRFFLAHGDGLGVNSLSYTLLNWIFKNQLCQRLFSMLPTRLAIGFGLQWSQRSRGQGVEPLYLGEEKEHLVRYTKAQMALCATPIDYYIYGHRHIELDLKLSRHTRMLILGDWVTRTTYAIFDGEDIWLENFQE